MMKFWERKQLIQKVNKLEKRNLQNDLVKLLEEYVKLPYEDHGYINPSIISLVIDAIMFNREEYELSYELSDWYHGMWSQ